MESNLWIAWAILAAVFIIGEIFTAGFFLIWFGIGAALAAVLAALGFNTTWQIGAFALGSGVLVLFSRRFAERVTAPAPQATNVDRLIGQVGYVLDDIDNARNTGLIRVESEEWRAVGEDDTPVPQGEKVRVLRVDGNRLVVQKMKEAA